MSNLSPHSYRSACISYFDKKQLIGEGFYGLHFRSYIVYRGEDRVVGREDTERAFHLHLHLGNGERAGGGAGI